MGKSVDCCWFLGGVRYPRYSNSFQIFSPLSLLSFNYDHFEFHHHSSSSLNVLSEVAKMPENLWTRTPLVESPSLSSAAGCRIFLKLDNYQPSGSFKYRGISHLMQSAVLNRSSELLSHLHYYCSSGGNAGIACATAARSMGYPATVVIPLATH